MKLAVLLFGISYLEEHIHWFKKDRLKIDYTKSVQNYQRRIFNYFKKQGYTIDIYLSTYKHKKINKLLEDYKPKKYIIIDTIIEDRNRSRNLHFENCLKLCKESNINYDLILITRFDLQFNKDFDRLDPKSMNIVSDLHHRKKIDDNLYIFPKSLLNDFIQICKNYRNKSYHLMKLDLKYKMNVNYLCDERKPVEKLTFFDIIRTTLNNTNVNNQIFKIKN